MNVNFFKNCFLLQKAKEKVVLLIIIISKKNF